MGYIYKMSIIHEKGRAMLGVVGLREKGKYYSKEKIAYYKMSYL